MRRLMAALLILAVASGDRRVGARLPRLLLRLLLLLLLRLLLRQCLHGLLCLRLHAAGDRQDEQADR